MLMFVLNLHYPFNITRILHIEDIDNWYSTATHYANCDVIKLADKTKNSN